MKIALFTDSFHPYISGVTFAVLNQANELVRQGHEVAIFRPKPIKHKDCSNPEHLDPAIQIHDVLFSIPLRKMPTLHITIPTFFLSTFKHVKAFSPDVIHAHSEWGCGWEAAFAAKVLHVPLVGTFHAFWNDPAYLRNLHLPTTPFFQKMMQKYCNMFFNRCNKVICPSQYVEKHLLQGGIKTKPITVSNGIHMPPLLNQDTINKQRAEYDIHGTAFIYVGRISQEKSLPLALKAFAEIKKKYPDTTFILLGGGPMEDDIRQLISELQLSDSVVMPGRVPHHRLIEENLFRLGDVFVTASTTENQPVSILEGISFGLPVIAAAARGNPELVSDSANGLLFESDNIDELINSMTYVLENPEKRKQMGASSRRMAEERHSITQVGAKLLDVYQEAYNEIMSKRQTKINNSE